MTHTPAVDSLEQKITIRANDIHWFEDAFRAWGNDDFAGALDGLNAAVNHFAALTRPAGGSERLRELAVELATAENAYRDSYQYKGPDHIETGRAWDRMRKAGDKLREALASPQGAEQRQEVLDRPARVGGRDFLAGDLVQRVVGRAHAEYDRHHATPHPEPAATQGDYPVDGVFRTMRDDATFEDYRDQLAVGKLTAVDQMAFDNMLHDHLEALSSPPGVQAAQVSDGMLKRARSYDCFMWWNDDTLRNILHYFLTGERIEGIAQPSSAAHGGEVSNG